MGLNISGFRCEYAITRPFSSRYFTPSIFVVGILWLTLITIVNIIAVGYETVPFTSLVYNSTGKLWYERFNPFWIPPGRSCDPSLIPLNTGVVTTVGFAQYTLRGYYDPGDDSSENGMNYHNTTFRNCSVRLIEWSQNLWASVQDQEWVGCNTSSEAYVAVSTSRDGNVLWGNSAYGWTADELFSLPGPINITYTLYFWSQVALGITQALAPVGRISTLHSALTANNLSSLRLAYHDDNNFNPLPQGATTNTPAGDSWTLFLVYTRQNETFPQEIWIPLVFTPTGEIDLTRTKASDLNMANIIMSPMVTLFAELGQPNLDIWRFINWIYVSIYWFLLAEFGQVAPTVYHAGGTILGSPISVPNASAPPISYTDKHNLFVNDTLFESYDSFFRHTVLPMFKASQTLPEYMEVDGVNRLNETDAGFVRTYSCLERRWKGLVEAVVSVLVADYALFFGAYAAVIWVASFIQKRNVEANCCEGCEGLLKVRDMGARDTRDEDILPEAEESVGGRRSSTEEVPEEISSILSESGPRRREQRPEVEHDAPTITVQNGPSHTLRARDHATEEETDIQPGQGKEGPF